VFADPEDMKLDVDDGDAEIDSDEAFGDSDAEKFEKKGFTFRGSGKPKEINGKKRRPTAADFMSDSDNEHILNGNAAEEDDEDQEDETDEDILDVDAQHLDDSEDESDDSAGDEGSDEDMEEEIDEESPPDEEEIGEQSESGSENEKAEMSQRAELRKIMNEEQKNVVATISKAAQADADKGNAVLQQRKTFDSLLSVRMALQKGLTAAKSIAAVEENSSEIAQELPYQAAEDAAIKLWNTLDGLRQELIKANGATTGQKRKRDFDSSTPSSTIWERMQDSELASLDNRQTTLEKWSNKVIDTTALPLSRKLHTAQPQSKIALLQDQVAKKVQENGNSSLFDDTKFYKTLLNNFVDQRRMDVAPVLGGQIGGPAQFTVVKEAKLRKKVDTKASKGRKMRFTVHEKLQNFMAPEDRGSWEPEAIDRFFGTLLGQKMTLGEDMEVDEDEDEIPLEEQGLMLFRS
jgi:protein AATF/BFR2